MQHLLSPVAHTRKYIFQQNLKNNNKFYRNGDNSRL